MVKGALAGKTKTCFKPPPPVLELLEQGDENSPKPRISKFFCVRIPEIQNCNFCEIQ